MADYQDRAAFLKAVSHAAKEGKAESRRNTFESNDDKYKKKRAEQDARSNEDAKERVKRAYAAAMKPRLESEDINDDDEKAINDASDLEGNIRDEYGPEAVSAYKASKDKVAQKRKKMEGSKSEGGVLSRVGSRIFGK